MSRRRAKPQPECTHMQRLRIFSTEQRPSFFAKRTEKGASGGKGAHVRDLGAAGLGAQHRAPLSDRNVL